jgi:hypothetical protein
MSSSNAVASASVDDDGISVGAGSRLHPAISGKAAVDASAASASRRVSNESCSSGNRTPAMVADLPLRSPDQRAVRYPMLWRGLAITGLLIGAAWRILQYVQSPSLHVDEAALGLQMLDNDFSTLFGRLGYGQVAPIGFRLAVKTCAVVFGTSEWSLRLFPLLCGLAALPAFHFVAGRMLERPAAAAATVLFSLATPLAIWSTLLKPYSCDVLCSLIVVAVAHHVMTSAADRRTTCIAAIAGALAALFSQAALFVLAPCGIVLIVDALRRRPVLRARLVIVGTWAAAAVAVAWWSRAVMRAADLAYMQKFWADHFMPLELPVMLEWLAVRFYDAMVGSPWEIGGLDYDLPIVWGVLVGAGAIAALRRGSQGLLLILPAVVTLLASAARVYPFGSRLILFLLPFLLILAVAGARQIAVLGGPRVSALAPLVLIPFAVVSFIRFPPRFAPEHVRPDLEYLAARLQPGDRVWVYYGAARAFEYYARRIPLRATTSFGICDRTDGQATLRQLDGLRGVDRAWIVITHAPQDEWQAMLHYLDAIGSRQDASSPIPERWSTSASAVYLYRLDDRSAEAVAAAGIRVPRIEAPRAWSCYGTMSRSPEGDLRAIEDLERTR